MMGSLEASGGMGAQAHINSGLVFGRGRGSPATGSVLCSRILVIIDIP
jgi:hypothetical protein